MPFGSQHAKGLFHLHSSSFTFWSSKLASSSRSIWNGIWTCNLNGSWTYKHSSHFNAAKEMSIKVHAFSSKNHNNNKKNDAEILLKSFWTSHLKMIYGRWLHIKNICNRYSDFLDLNNEIKMLQNFLLCQNWPAAT